ncbi:YybH family protein [Sphingomonas aerophila]|jgi:uncharacterized protein (TIGR02246 family)|uniref:Uncharacterized protein (TIGR02246 family) n=1 Tax=Sphingomonas aerophila TaxID=1344948 RepID=A0A7W9BBC6_9SPHN|nr:DUF4440 domain-containing protein [Sphingomonas aerophila]MBB5713864.1 uncharacterized protein (TIGR02246 family) [Sphingomonas aerophila]
MIRAGGIAAALLTPLLLAAAAPDPIGSAMEDSAAGWNAGDLGRFMRVYAEDAVFVTSRGLVRGKAAVAARYRPSFAKGGNSRGKLSFRFLGTRTIDARHRLLWAKWTLRGAKVESGMTTLLFERRPAGWQIISDHSS